MSTIVEYRIVGTKIIKHKNGKVDRIENIKPSISGYGSYSLIYTDESIARRELEEAKRDLAEWSEKHNMNAVYDPYGVILQWDDLHLEKRLITPWEKIPAEL